MGSEDTFSRVMRIVDLPVDQWEITMTRGFTNNSPSYNITAPWVTEVRRIRSKGCSGTTLHSKNRSGLPFAIRVACVLTLFPAFSQG